MPFDAARRKVLAGLALAASGLAGVLVGVPFLGALVTPLRRRDEHGWRVVGVEGDFPPGKVVKVTLFDPDAVPWSGYSAESAALVRRDEDGSLVAFAAHCTHVGCAVRWMSGAQLFVCPCHGGAFHPDGSVAAGPPPFPLATHEIRLREGKIEVQTRPIPGVSRRP